MGIAGGNQDIDGFFRNWLVNPTLFCHQALE
jgi:hypothetical protein